MVSFRTGFEWRALRALVVSGAAALGALFCAEGIAGAQENAAATELWGRVYLAGDTISLPGAVVQVVGSAVTSTTNRAGLYRLVGVRPGRLTIEVRMLGYAPRTVGVEIGASRTQRQDVTLSRLPNALAEIVIEGRVRRVPARFDDVYRRMSRANGKFFTREDIDELSPPDVEGILLRTPTIQLNAQGISFPKCTQGGAYALQPGAKATASVQIYVDGVRMTGKALLSGGRDAIAQEQQEVLRSVVPSQIQAIEVYSGSSRIPGEYLNDACAVILIWTKSY